MGTTNANGGLTRDELIQYLTIYQKAVRQHAADAAKVLRLTRQLEALDRGQPLAPRKRGRPPKGAHKNAPVSRANLEKRLAVAQARLDRSWSLYKQLDDMDILPGHASRWVQALLRLLKSGQASSLEDALAQLDR